MSTDINQRAFLAAFAECGQITKAAEAAQLDRGLHYRWLREVPEYPEAFRQAELEYGDNLEGAARQRAKDGVSKNVYYKGEVVGQQLEYSDTLMAKLLEGAKPEKYSRRAVEHTGKDGAPLAIKVQFVD